MPGVALVDISHSFGPQRLFSGVSMTLSTGDRFALTGANGSGKSTLMRILCGQIKPESGKVMREKGTRITYLPQSNAAIYGKTLFQEAEMAYRRLADVRAEMREVENKLEHVEERSPEAGSLLSRYTELQDALEAGDYYGRENAIEKVLTGLGFSEEEFKRPADQFSSGWQMRIALARVLLEDADVLLLDEPTNYLDMEAREWLESYLSAFHGSVLVVSHDRYFLDVTVSRVMEITDRRILSFGGNYTEYETKRQAELQEVIKSYHKQQEEIEKAEAFIRKFRYNASKARLVRSRVNALERMQRIEIPPGLQKIHFRFPEPPHSGRVTVQIRSLSKSYNGKPALSQTDLDLLRGERLALVGPNGAGKSTLMRLLANLLEPDGGEIRYGKGVTIGYFSPEYEPPADKAKTVLQTVEDLAPTEMFPRLKNLLGAFLFRGDDVHKPVSVLSGGEQSRLSLVQILLHPPNFLLLDEPTNHLDMVSKDILLDTLQRFGGSLVFVSHDRYFIQKLATKVLELDRGRPSLYFGDYEYYLWKKAGQQESRAVGRPGGQSQGDGRDARKGIQAELRRLQREEEEVLQALDRLEAESEGIQEELAQAYRDGERMKELKRRTESNSHRQRELARRWEELESEIHRLKAQVDG